MPHKHQAPPGPRDYNNGDRNGEPAEADWGCFLIAICAAAIVAIVVIALLGAVLADGPYSVHTMRCLDPR